MGKNVLIKIEYDGTDFRGWQIQPDVRTVQGTIKDRNPMLPAACAAVTVYFLFLWNIGDMLFIEL